MASSEEKVHGPAHRPPPTELESPTGESPDNGVLVGAGKIAGIGGIALVVLLFVYRELIRSTLFPTMKESSAAILIGAVVLFTFLISIIAIFSWHTKAAMGYLLDSGSPKM